MPWIPLVPEGLSDLSDVDTDGAVDGNALVYNSGTWAPGEVASGGGGGGGSHSETIGDGSNSSFQVTHDLGTQDLVVQLWDLTGADPVEATADADSFTVDDDNNLTVAFSAPPAADSYRVVILSDGGTGSGGGGGGALFPLIGEPTFGESGDADFRGAADLGPYTAVGTSAGTVSMLETGTSTNKYQITDAGLLVQVGNNQDAQFRADYTLPDGASMLMAVIAPRFTTGDNAAVALRLNDNDTSSMAGNWVSCMMEQDSTEWVVQANSSADASGAEMTQEEVEIPRLLLFRIARAGLTYSCWISHDGLPGYIGFQQTVAGALSNVWIAVEGTSTIQTYAPAILIPFIAEGSGTNPIPW